MYSGFPLYLVVTCICWPGSWSKCSIRGQSGWCRLQLCQRVNGKLHNKHTGDYGWPHVVHQKVHWSISWVLGQI